VSRATISAGSAALAAFPRSSPLRSRDWTRERDARGGTRGRGVEEESTDRAIGAGPAGRRDERGGAGGGRRDQCRRRAALKAPYRRVIRPAGDWFSGEVGEFPGCYASGNTEAEARENLEEAMGLWIEAELEGRHEIPEPLAGRPGPSPETS
jgi:predicted RNase H-like HicB family nuclease